MCLMSTRSFEKFLERAVTVTELEHQVRALLAMGDAAPATVARLATQEGFPCDAEEVLQVMAYARAVRNTAMSHKSDSAGIACPDSGRNGERGSAPGAGPASSRSS
jgi:hypothetical protein